MNLPFVQICCMQPCQLEPVYKKAKAMAAPQEILTSGFYHHHADEHPTDPLLLY
jgi:hypothetical protein